MYFDLLRTAISTGGGQEVKTLGDGLMVAFTSSGEPLMRRLVTCLACGLILGLAG